MAVATLYKIKSQKKTFAYFKTMEDANTALPKIEKRNPKIKNLAIYPETGNWSEETLNGTAIYDELLT